MACTGCASELTSGDLCGVCLEAGWEQHACGCLVDPEGEHVVLCDSHETIRNERAWERMSDDYYGASTPQTIQEQCDAADMQKRGWR